MAGTGVNIKKRYWACIVYPESAPEDWIDILQKTGLPVAISPLHDKDVNPTGEPKKSHYHVILCWAGPARLSVAKAVSDSLNAPNPKALENVKGYYRYLTHRDNPEKAQYSEQDIRTLNGFNIADFSDLTRSEVLEVKRRLQGLIRDSGIYEYSDLMDLLLDSDMGLEYEVASNHTFFFEKYISSRRNKNKEKIQSQQENR